MSLAKYMQLYREYGFFNGSTIRVRIPDTSFYGSDLILSKDGNVLRTRTIDDDVVDFFTDESGTLVLSADNGTSTLSGEVKISAYGTYNITLEGVSVDKSREVYAEKDVTLDDDKTTDTVAIGYTGDISKISAVSSNTSVCTVSVNGNKVTVKDAGKDFNGKATITATVEASQNYDAGEVNFYVNKLNGSLGTWADASDDVIASMIAQADAGEINLADFWQIGETRRVHLNEIPAGTETAMQTEQDIDLVIMHNPLGDSKYMLANPTVGNRYQPNFIIGMVDCLENLSSMGYVSKTISTIYSSSSYSNQSYVSVHGNDEAELLTMLNGDFIEALPAYLQNSLKLTKRLYVCAGGDQSADVGDDRVSYTTTGNAQHKVSLANIRELGFLSSISKGSGSYSMPSGIGVYNASGSTDRLSSQTVADYGNNNVNACGTKFQFYINGATVTKKNGTNGRNVDYLVPDTFMFVSMEEYGGSYLCKYSTAFYINEDGVLSTNNLIDAGQRTKLRGVSPIMFI